MTSFVVGLAILGSVIVGVDVGKKWAHSSGTFMLAAALGLVCIAGATVCTTVATFIDPSIQFFPLLAVSSFAAVGAAAIKSIIEFSTRE